MFKKIENLRASDMSQFGHQVDVPLGPWADGPAYDWQAADAAELLPVEDVDQPPFSCPAGHLKRARPPVLLADSDDDSDDEAAVDSSVDSDDDSAHGNESISLTPLSAINKLIFAHGARYFMLFGC